MTRLAVRRALLSVSDKSGLISFARRLVAHGVQIVSSGGTAEALAAVNIDSERISDLTGYPELLGGRVKTLHPSVFGAILSERGNPQHLRELEAAGIEPFELVVVGFYPFETVARKPTARRSEAIEHIDIGGPSLARAAAKNHESVGIVTSPDQYEEVAAEIEAGGLSYPLRDRLAREAFFRTASYDAAILDWFSEKDGLPDHLVIPVRRALDLRYGENPHQDGAAYRTHARTPWWMAAQQLQGKQMSYNNYADADAAWQHAAEYPDPAVVIVKHTNPCGVAQRSELIEAFEAAWDCDPDASFGSVVALNRPLQADLAAMVAERFIEVVVAPVVSPAAAEQLATSRNLRVLEAPVARTVGYEVRQLEEGFLLQTPDRPSRDSDWKTVSRREPRAAEIEDLRFAAVVAAHTKSNGFVVARARTAVGIGAGDQSRVGAARRALHQAGDRAERSVAASDAFLPFRDTIDLLAEAGVTALTSPGGSIRDDQVIDAADERGLALVFGSRRHFRH